MYFVFCIPALLYILTSLYIFIFKKKFFLLFFSILTLFVSIFGATYIESIDLDFGLYNSYFEGLYSVGFSEIIDYSDPLFWSLVKIVNLLIDSNVFYNFFFIIFISFFLKGIIAKENLPTILIPMFLYLVASRYLVLHDYTQIRVGIAIGINTIILLRFINNGRLEKRELILVVLSFFIHFSSIVFVLVYFLLKKLIKKDSFKILLFLLLFSVLVGQFFSDIFQVLLNNLSWLERLDVYASNSSDGAEQIQKYSIFQFYFLFKVLVLIFFIKGYNFLSNADRALVCLFVISMCIQSIFVFNSAIGLRLASLFGYFDILAMLIPLKYSYFNKVKHVYYLGLFSVGMVFLYSSMLGVMNS